MLGFKIMFFIIAGFAFLTIAFTVVSIFSPKLRAKMIKRQIRATKYMMEESQKDLEDLSSIVAQTSINSQKKILDKNEDVIRDVSVRNANIEAEAIEEKAKALKKGFTQDRIHCKYCGKNIDEDSEFCKFCGKSLK